MKLCLGSWELLLGREEGVDYFFFLYFLLPKYILSGNNFKLIFFKSIHSMMLSGKPTSFIILFSPSVLVRKESESS